jgi:hypothetical protein
VTDAEFEARIAASPSDLDPRRCRIDADNSPSRTHAIRGDSGEPSRPTADIEQSFAGMNRKQVDEILPVNKLWLTGFVVAQRKVNGVEGGSGHVERFVAKPSKGTSFGPLRSSNV